MPRYDVRNTCRAKSLGGTRIGRYTHDSPQKKTRHYQKQRCGDVLVTHYRATTQYVPMVRENWDVRHSTCLCVLTWRLGHMQIYRFVNAGNTHSYRYCNKTSARVNSNTKPTGTGSDNNKNNNSLQKVHRPSELSRFGVCNTPPRLLMYCFDISFPHRQRQVPQARLGLSYRSTQGLCKLPCVRSSCSSCSSCISCISRAYQLYCAVSALICRLGCLVLVFRYPAWTFLSISCVYLIVNDAHQV